MADPNGFVKTFLAEHNIANDVCSCGWNMADYDIVPYEWESDSNPARRRAWVAHITRVWRRSNPLGKIQQASTLDPNGNEVVWDMEPGHDTLRETPVGLGRAYHGEYRYADYEPPPRDDDQSTRITCEEAECRDPHCLGGHFRLTLPVPPTCAKCKQPFDADEEVIAVVMQVPGGREITDGMVMATSASYHASCQPSERELRDEAEERWPTLT